MRVMRKQLKKAVLGITFTAFAVCAFVVCKTNVKALANTATTEAFDSYGITMVPSQSIPSEIGVNDNRKGLLLKSDAVGSRIRIKNSVQGEFTTDFRVYSDETFVGSATSALYENDSLDLRKMHFDFIGDGNKSFSVYFEGGVGGNNVSPNVYVSYDGEKSGLYYDAFDKLIGNTKYFNSVGVYTVLNGTSFCNSAWIGDGCTTQNCESTVLKFDPEDMSVYAGANNSDLKLVWSLTEEELDGKKVQNVSDSFADYTVEIVFDEIKANKTAKMLINEINGVATNWDYVGTDKAVLSADVRYNAVVGKKYELPTCRISNWAKSVNGEVAVKVLNADGQEMPISDNGFTPNKEGEYIISYSYKDEKKEYAIRALPEETTRFVLEDKYSEFSLGTGAEITLFPCKYTSDLFKNGFTRDAVVSVYKDNAVLPEYEKITLKKARPFVFEESGEYRIEYASADERIESKSSYVFSVQDGKIVFDNVYLKSVQYLNGTVTVPTVKAHLGGTDYATDFNFVMPDGSRYKNKTYKLSQTGRYAIEYVAVIDGQKYVKTVAFDVVLRASDLFEGEYYTITTDSYFINDNVSGAKFTTSVSGSVAKYKNDVVFDGESGIKRIASLIIVPTNKGIKDFEDVYVQLTDKTDPTNKIVFMVSNVFGTMEQRQ